MFCKRGIDCIIEVLFLIVTRLRLAKEISLFCVYKLRCIRHNIIVYILMQCLNMVEQYSNVQHSIA